MIEYETAVTQAAQLEREIQQLPREEVTDCGGNSLAAICNGNIALAND